MHPHNDDEEKIFKATSDFQNAWNTGDEKNLASYFAVNCLRVGAFGEIQNGRSEVEKAYAQLLKKELPGSKINNERGTIRFLSPELATWQGPFEIFSSGAKSIKGYTLLILKKQDNNWLIEEMHPKIYPA